MGAKTREKAWFIYIVVCSDSTYYTGITTDVARRIKAHNGDIKGGAKYTRFKRPVTLVHTEEFKNRSEASIREYQLKQLSREEKTALFTKN